MPKIVTDENGKKRQVFDPSNPEDMKIAHEMAKKQYEKLKGKMEQESETEEKLEKAEDAQKLFDELKSNIEQRYIDEGLRIPNITSKDSLNDATENIMQIQKLKENQNRPVKPEGEGNAPLNDAQKYGGNYNPEAFFSEREMIDKLLLAKRRGNKEAQKVLDQLLIKTLKGVKEQEHGVKTFNPEIGSESEIQRLNRIKREKQSHYEVESL